MNFANSCDGRYSEYSLDCRALKGCDNNCSFCIEKCGIDSLGETNVGKMIGATIASGKSPILILGGEPLLIIPKIKQYILGIRKHVKEIFLTTSLPRTIYDNWDEFAEVMELLDGLNISLQHYDWQLNNQVLNASSNHNRIEMLQKICVTWTDKVRVSINLVKGFIDSKEKIDEFLQKMDSIGVKHVKINELQNNEEDYVSFCDVYGMKLKSPYSHGCQFDINIHKNIRVTLRRACFFVNKNLYASFSDLLKVIVKKVMRIKRTPQVVMYEDGSLSCGWKQKTK